MKVRMRSTESGRFRLAAIVAVLLAAALLAHAGEIQARAMAGRQAYPARVLTELQGFLGQSEPVGLVLGRNDSDQAPARGDSAPLSDPAQIFRQRWATSFEIEHSNGAMTVMSPRARLCRAGLARSVPSRTVSGSPLEVLFGIASTFDASLRQLPPPGTMNGGPAPSQKSQESVSRQIAVKVEPGSLQAALTRLVTSSLGVGWLASERCDGPGRCGCYLSLFTEESVLWTSYDAAAGLQLQGLDPAKR